MKAMTVNLKHFQFSFKSFYEAATRNWKLIVLYLLFSGGCVAGAMIYTKSHGEIAPITQTLLEKALNCSFVKLVTAFISTYILCILVTFFSSFNALGLPLIMICPTASGTIFSLINSHLYNSYRIDGVIFSIVLIIPAAVVFSILLLTACNEALIMSGTVAQTIFTKQAGNRGELRDFFIRYLIITAVCIVISIIQSACIYKLGELLLV